MRGKVPNRKQRRKKLKPRRAELSLLEDAVLASGVQSLSGVDEVGRGCLAGPVVAAAVVYCPDAKLPPVADSKVLSPQEREKLYGEIQDRCRAWAVASVSAPELDRLNIHRASLLAMKQAVAQLSHQPDYVLVDGRFPLELKIPQQAVIDGDNLCQVISAASIIAKVWRDRYMVRLQEQYPRFSFGQHKGYGTQQHREELRQNGPTPEHRRSFRGVVSS